MKPDSSMVFYLWMNCVHSVTQPNYVASVHLSLTLLQFLLFLESWQFSVLAETESASLGEVVEVYWSTRSLRWGVVGSSWWSRLYVYLCVCVCVCLSLWHFTPVWQNYMAFHCYPSYQIIWPLDIPSRSYGRKTIFSQILATFDLERWHLTPIETIGRGWHVYTNTFICSSCTWMCLFMLSHQISFPLDIPSWSYGWKLSSLAKVQWPLTFDLEQIDSKPPEHISISCSIPGPHMMKICPGIFLKSPQ